MSDCVASGVSPEDSPELAKSASANDQGAFSSLYAAVIPFELGFLGQLEESFLVPAITASRLRMARRSLRQYFGGTAFEYERPTSHVAGSEEQGESKAKSRPVQEECCAGADK